MNVENLIHVLETNSTSPLRFKLPTGEFIPNHFHITEVGRVDKSFIDCGGTQRQSASCLLQAWTANDIEHRLMAGKLAQILKLAEPLLRSVDLPVEVEYGSDCAVQYAVTDVVVTEAEMQLRLTGKQTDCLARDRCGVGACETSECCS